MHVVITAYAAVHPARRDSLLVFALIYALYFFPWRLVRERMGARTAVSEPGRPLVHDGVHAGS